MPPVALAKRNLTWKWSKDHKQLVVSLVLDMEELSTSLMRGAGLINVEDVGGAAASIFLTNREKDVLSYLVKGSSAKEVSAALNISIRTVKFYASSLYKKFGVQTKTELMRYMLGAAR